MKKDILIGISYAIGFIVLVYLLFFLAEVLK